MDSYISAVEILKTHRAVIVDVGFVAEGPIGPRSINCFMRGNDLIWHLMYHHQLAVF